MTWGLENATFIPKTITTLGSYDGMHRGHVEILRHLNARKEQLRLERSLVLTFDPHPQEILHKNNTEISLLTNIDERLSLFEKTGIDEVLVIRFSMEFAKTPYNVFFHKTLIETLGTKAMVVGFNHAFGKNREGDIDHLKILASEAGITVEEVPPLIINGISVSSTKIRHALLDGNLALANEFLGRPYELSGIVIEGDKLGRTLGFPTANLKVQEHKLIPADGVYSCLAWIGDKSFKSAVSIGKRPTVTSDGIRTIEAYLLDFDQEIYGIKLSLQFQAYIRPQEKFATVEDLKKQMNSDVAAVRFNPNNLRSS